MLFNIVGGSIKTTKGGFVMKNTNKVEKPIKAKIRKNTITVILNMFCVTAIINFCEPIIANGNSFVNQLISTLLMLICIKDFIVDIIIAIISIKRDYSKLIKESVEL